ncbi:MAG: hypothetical protein JRH11_15810 [Deltaproteobacteria bacterium]|nr:hypothetical protein [Deltaproteobacteria bacterium]
MDVRLFFTLLSALTLIAAPAIAQDPSADPAPEAAREAAPAEPAPAASPSPSADDGSSSSSTTATGSTTAAGAGTATAGDADTTTAGGAQPGDAWAETPVIHEPVGTTSGTNQAATPAAQPEEDDDGRDADLLWLEVGFGYSWVDLAAFSANNFVPGVDQISGSGYTGHAAAGIKLFFLTLGARGTVASYPKDTGGFDIWSLMFDVMLRLPVPLLEPYVRAGIGYAWMGSLNHSDLGNSSVSVYGLTIEAGAGLDVYLGKYFSLGAGFDIAFLNLTRQRIDNCDSVGGAMCNIGGVDFQEEGDAAGFQIRATGHAALHF